MPYGNDTGLCNFYKQEKIANYISAKKASWYLIKLICIDLSGKKEGTKQDINNIEETGTCNGYKQEQKTKNRGKEESALFIWNCIYIVFIYGEKSDQGKAKRV